MTRIILLGCAFAMAAWPLQRVSAQQADSCTQISFGGEVKTRDGFTRNIGNGLAFRLDPQGDSGWEFEIGPSSPAPDEWDQYVYVLTPPYRGSNAREVNTGWGTTAQDAVRADREFWFLVFRDDAPRAEQAINEVLWPESEADQAAALNRLASLPRGHGEFKVLDFSITPGLTVPGHSDCKPLLCGEIHWIKFQVIVTVPRDFTPADGLPASSSPCPKSRPF